MQLLQPRRRALDKYARSSLAGGLLLIIGLALALVGCTLPALPSAGPPPAALPQDVPLPENSTFANIGHSAQVGARVWIYTVPNTNIQQIEAFYRTALPQQGWTNYHPAFATPNGDESVSITAQGIGRGLNITAGSGPTEPVTAPAHGVTLQITLLPTGV